MWAHVDGAVHKYDVIPIALTGSGWGPLCDVNRSQFGVNQRIRMCSLRPVCARPNAACQCRNHVHARTIAKMGLPASAVDNFILIAFHCAVGTLKCIIFAYTNIAKPPGMETERVHYCARLEEVPHISAYSYCLCKVVNPFANIRTHDPFLPSCSNVQFQLTCVYADLCRPQTPGFGTEIACHSHQYRALNQIRIIHLRAVACVNMLRTS